MMKKKIILLFFSLGLLLIMIFSIGNNKVIKDKTLYMDNNNSFEHCPYSDEYIVWSKLSDEEKEKTIMPSVCKKSITTSTKFVVNPTDISVYDLRNVNGVNYLPNIKNQMDQNTCWAFAPMSSIETSMMISHGYSNDLSERHLQYYVNRTFDGDVINELGYNKLNTDGGNPYMSSNYFMNNYGPIHEIDMPYKNNSDLIDISEIHKTRSILDVNAISFNGYTSCTSTAINEIKQLILDYGSVDANMYMNDAYYSPTEASYFYNKSNYSNHAINIVGWNDNYSKTKFKNIPARNGAWIIKGTYGTQFGENGYFYVSYDDVNICNNIISYRDIDLDFVDNNYIYDTLGYSNSIGRNGIDTAYGANIFTKSRAPELLSEITFATIAKTNYEIYVNSINGSIKEEDLTLVKSGTINYEGYTTIKLDEDILLNGTQFAVVIKYNTPNYYFPVPVLDPSLEFYKYFTNSSNKSFFGFSLSTMADLTTNMSNGAITIKAGTKNVPFTDSTIKLDRDFIILGNGNNGLNLDNDLDYEFELYNENDTEYVSGEIIKTGMKVKLKDSDDYSYNVVVVGDVSKDGQIMMNDLMSIANYLVDDTYLKDGTSIKAADYNLDGSVRMNDVMKMATDLVEGS